MKEAEPRKLFGRPSGMLLDEKPSQALPPPIRLEPGAGWRAPTAAADSAGGMRIRSVASLPDELEDPDEMEDEGELGDAGDDAADESDVWGAAFEVDDFRAQRRDPDEDLIRTPAQVHVMASPMAGAGEDEDDVVAMPEEGDEAEATGVGEQVAMPEGFADDLDLAMPADEAPAEPIPAATRVRSLPPVAPPARPADGLRTSGIALSRGVAPPPRVLTRDAAEGLAVAWMGASAGDATDLPDIVEDHHSRIGPNREARMALLEAAVFGEAQRQNAPPATPAVDLPAWSPESAPGPDSTAVPTPRSRFSLPPANEPPAPAPRQAADPPGHDEIPDAVAALAEAMQRDTPPSGSIAPRAKRPTGEAPRILRRGREPEPPAPAQSAKATRPMFDGDGVTPRRLGRLPQPPDDDGGELRYPGTGDAPEFPRRTRPPPRAPEPPAGARPAEDDIWGPSHRNADGRGRVGPPPIFPEMPAPSFALPEIPVAPAQPPPDLPRPPRASMRPESPRQAPPAEPTRPDSPRQTLASARTTQAPGRAAPRQGPRVTRVPRAATRETDPRLVMVLVFVSICGLLTVVVPRMIKQAQPPAQGVDLAVPAAAAEAQPEVAVATTPIAAGTPVPAPSSGIPPRSDAASAYKVSFGIIRVSTDKRALIILDGKQQGYAPGLADISVAPGQHTVRGVIAGGRSRSIEVRVDAGTAVVASFNFAAE